LKNISNNTFSLSTNHPTILFRINISGLNCNKRKTENLNNKIKSEKMKSKLTLLTALLIIFPCFTILYSQPLKKTVTEKENYSLTLYGGVSQNKIATDKNNGSSGLVGLRVAYDVNEKLSLGAEVSYNSMREKDNSSSLFHMTYGPRYYVNLEKIGSSIFFEVAMGGYMYPSEEPKENTTTDSPGRNTPVSDLQVRNSINIGVSGSLGGEVSLSKNLGFTLRGRYHNIFESDRSTNFYSFEGGIRIKL
jgi:Outer membrane protein beta-barrel domain